MKSLERKSPGTKKFGRDSLSSRAGGIQGQAGSLPVLLPPGLLAESYSGKESGVKARAVPWSPTPLLQEPQGIGEDSWRLVVRTSPVAALVAPCGSRDQSRQSSPRAVRHSESGWPALSMLDSPNRSFYLSIKGIRVVHTCQVMKGLQQCLAHIRCSVNVSCYCSRESPRQNSWRESLGV